MDKLYKFYYNIYKVNTIQNFLKFTYSRKKFNFLLQKHNYVYKHTKYVIQNLDFNKYWLCLTKRLMYKNR